MDRNPVPASSSRGARRRLPRGGRGSQQRHQRGRDGHRPSPPARGAWIATWRVLEGPAAGEVASREGGVDRNRAYVSAIGSAIVSPPARGAWIATCLLDDGSGPVGVASREGGVDRNRAGSPITGPENVASREGGVDRNVTSSAASATPRCRLPRGGRGSQHATFRSRRQHADVASREGGVDRNIRCESSGEELAVVASREGGVDRNTTSIMVRPYDVRRLPRGGRGSQQRPGAGQQRAGGRLPRGGRGSQLLLFEARATSPKSPPARGAWIAT